ncbi:MAG: nitrilase-related carbon-nitrogen hydrolase [Geminicoccaceae bacterium]
MPEQDHLQQFHKRLVLQAGAYQNGTWVVGVAKCGVEEGCMLIGESCIVAPTGGGRPLLDARGRDLRGGVRSRSLPVDQGQHLRLQGAPDAEYGLLTQR